MVRLAEDQRRDRYAFDDQTVAELCGLLARYERVCCLCAPSLAEAMYFRGRDVCALDTDRRFAQLPGFVAWDVRRPRLLDRSYDLVLCDPPLTVQPQVLFTAVHTLARFRPATRVAVAWPARREEALLRAFAPFGLRPTGYAPGYRSAPASESGQARLYANFDDPLWPAPSSRLAPEAIRSC